MIVCRRESGGTIRRACIFVCFGLFLALDASGKAQAQAPAASFPGKVDGPQISTLVRTTLIALHQANITGNYTVFRDLTAQSIREKQNPSDLAEIFRPIRNSGLDLSKTVIFDPLLHKKPALSQNGMLQITGHFPTQPEAIHFDLIFMYEARGWRIARVQLDAKPTLGAQSSSAGRVPKPKHRPTIQNAQAEKYEW